jgi:hypothetical protein
MSKEVTLKLGLLRERLIRTMASLPAAVVSVTLCTVHSIHVAGDEMFLKSTGIGESSTTRGFDSMKLGRPFANM